VVFGRLSIQHLKLLQKSFDMSQELSQKAKNAAQELREYFVFYPDFPKKGIEFWLVSL